LRVIRGENISSPDHYPDWSRSSGLGSAIRGAPPQGQALPPGLRWFLTFAGRAIVKSGGKGGELQGQRPGADEGPAELGDALALGSSR